MRGDFWNWNQDQIDLAVAAWLDRCGYGLVRVWNLTSGLYVTIEFRKWDGEKGYFQLTPDQARDEIRYSQGVASLEPDDLIDALARL